MLGYVTINKDELKTKEFELYRGYYCGVCKSIARYGIVPRFALSYDSAFLALILESLREDAENLKNEHCILHHIKKNPVVKDSASVDYAADMLLILAYYNFLDDKEDEHKIRGMAGEIALRKAYNKLSKKYDYVCTTIEKGISELSALEKEKSPSLDMTAEVFGRTLRAVFCEFYHEEAVNRVLGELGENLGKWIYVMDALDDLEEDKKSGAYNPLIYRDGGTENLEDTIYNYLGRVSMAVDMLDIKKNKGIIDNVILLGLRGRADSLIKKDSQEGK